MQNKLNFIFAVIGAAVRNCPALQTVGYKEIFEYLDGKIPLEEAIRLIQRNTRHYAKKQLTWWKRAPSVRWLDISTKNSVI